jgi:outer membrane receptor protein involved in Fe transport
MVAQGFRAPHMDDLAKNSTTFGGQTIANPDLESEQSLTGELSVDWNNPVWKTSFAVWHTGLSDAIGARLVNDGGTPGVGGDDTYQRDNVGRASLYGFEVQASRKLSGPESDWSLGAGIAWTEGKQYDETIDPATGTAPGYDVPFRRVPPLVGELSLEYEPSKPDTVVHWGELSFVAADDQDKLSPEDKLDPRIDPNGTPGWARLDLDVGGPLGNIAGSRWSVGVHNILDRAYRMHGSGLDAPGINAVFGVEWVF